ncbi:hypothetical protein ColLi_12686 [Colletotrichum liriopes]|uniref:PD-(D/E)XK nuclease-like domain-containing protein n=1 Tax=Colletotrichum liriopes TaxID=708192 RepID=A0AA37LZW8_9PEZI|nr:hypothetical protein ColLi_12686 [Colletotrichum liriopes]
MTIPSLLPSESGSSRRSRSPVKGMANLEFAERPVRVVTPKSLAQIPEDIRTLCEEASRVRDGVAVIPASIREEVDNMMKSIRLRRKKDLLHELDTLAWVVRDSERASVGNLCEAHWNDRVHTQLLAAAIERDIASPTTQSHETNGDDDGCTVSVLNCTQAKIAASCVPRHASKGIDLEAKMVDYCISIRDSDIERTARRAVQAQLWKPTASASSSAASSSAASVSSAGDAFSSPRKRKAPTPLQSINHTEYDPLCLAPITVSIETKKPGGSEDGAKAQLSVWASAQILRLRQLLGDPEKPLGITFPLLLVTGPTWQLLFAVEKEDCIVSRRSLRLHNCLGLVH